MTIDDMPAPDEVEVGPNGELFAHYDHSKDNVTLRTTPPIPISTAHLAVADTDAGDGVVVIFESDLLPGMPLAIRFLTNKLVQAFALDLLAVLEMIDGEKE